MESIVKKEKKIQIDDIILLQPTSPLRKYSDLIKAYKIFKNKKLISLTSVTKVRENSMGHVKLIKNKQKWKFLYKSKKKLFEDKIIQKDIIILTEHFIFVIIII